jgi:hypothetical protein
VSSLPPDKRNAVLEGIGKVFDEYGLDNGDRLSVSMAIAALVADELRMSEEAFGRLAADWLRAIRAQRARTEGAS